ncbi:hypothetical protein Dxin01_00752 [Deinococcus xinjiangensis]|uniref:Uncharacterized protein n=1 Tax=Deinococcus xinjiangensis TaxID=457454 RepID=A0ABP9V8S5_9DEIO
MITGSLIGKVTTRPQAIGRAGQVFNISTGECQLAVLVTHELASKAMRQLECGKTVFLRVDHIADGHLHVCALEVLQNGTSLWNTFTVCGEVAAWPTAEPQVEVQLAVDTMNLVLRTHDKSSGLGAVAPQDQVQAWGHLRCEGDEFILEADHLERVQP